MSYRRLIDVETTLRVYWYPTIGTEFLDDKFTVASSLTNYPDEKQTFSCMDQNILVLRQTNQF